MNIAVDTAKLPTSCLTRPAPAPPSQGLWPDFCARADKEGWPAARLLTALAELELAEREQAPHPAPSCRGPPAGRQDPRWLRLHLGAQPQQGPSHGPG